MRKYFEILRVCPLFENVSGEKLMPLLDCINARVVRFKKDQTVIAEGSPAKNIGIVLSGIVHIMQIDCLGNRSILSRVEPSELFGESFAGADVSAIPINVIANTDCEILLFDCEKIAQICTNACQAHRQMIHNMIKIVANKNLMFHQKIEVTSKRSTKEKLMTYLMLQAKKHGSKCFKIPFDRQALADYLEVERSGLSAQISKLRSEGIIKCRKNRFEIIK